MDDYIHRIGDRIHFNFEDHFNYEQISPEQISFARYYIENIMGIDLDSDSIIEFTSIRSTIFGYLVAHLALEYEEFKKRESETGFKPSPPDEK